MPVKRLLLYLLLSLGSIPLAAAPAAAKSFSLAISPPVTEVITRPGTTIDIPLTVTNNSETTQITILPQLFTNIDSLGHVQPTADKSAALAWLTVTQPDSQTGAYTLPTGQPTKFTLTLAIPATAPDGDHQLAIFFQSLNPDTISAGNRSGTLSLGRVASLILLTVSSAPTIDSTASISSLSVPRLVDSFSSLPATLLVTNTGPHFTKLTGTLTLENSLTHTKWPTALASTNILAHTERYLLASASAVLADSTSTQSAASPFARLLSYLPHHRTSPPELNLHQPRFLLGAYTLTAQLYPVDAAGQLSASVSFVALPYKLMALISLLALAVYCFRLLPRHRLKKPLSTKPD